MGLAKICPMCMGCGRTSLDIFGKSVPQPTHTSNDTTSQGWSECTRCLGSGVVALIDGGRFANGFSIDEYLQNRFRS